MDSEKKISPAVINRLPRYYRYLGDLLESDITRISSKELSAKMNITASQIRQDLNNFGGFGQQGYGYNVEYLYNEIKKILGLDRLYNMIVVGGGNIGQALVNYTNFEKRGFVIKAVFDINPRLIGMTIRGVEVYDGSLCEKQPRGCCHPDPSPFAGGEGSQRSGKMGCKRHVEFQPCGSAGSR